MNDTTLLIGVVIFAALVLGFVLDCARKVKTRAPADSSAKKVDNDKHPAPEPLSKPAPRTAAEPEIEQPATAKSEPTTPIEITPDDFEIVIQPVSESTPAAESKPEQKSEPKPEPEPEPKSLLARVKQGLSRTRSSLGEGLSGLLRGKKAIDEDLLEEIEEQLLMADMGVEAVSHVINQLTEQLERKALKDSDALYAALKQELRNLIKPCAVPLKIENNKPYVILMVGVNGAGKTTTIGKLAKRLQNEGHSVMLAAGDTFRAAAVEQLQEWGTRNDVPVIAQHTGADSASVIFDAVSSARARGIDVLIADTAGRLQNKDNLMAELTKVKRVMAKLDEAAPHEVMLVLDAGTGQNALSQAALFNKAVGVTGISLTKLDGTAKGGVIFAIAKQLGMPIRFIGVGEKIDDLRPFDADEFVEALFD